MPAWLRNERVDFWLAVIIGVIIGSSPAIIVPIVENLLPGVVWWPGAWLICTSVALIVAPPQGVRQMLATGLTWA